MATVPLSGEPKQTAEVDSEQASEQMRADKAKLFDDDLMDLYAAIVIVVPIALFLKSLWS